MAFSRYSGVPKILNRTQYGTSRLTSKIFLGCESGRIKFRAHTLQGGERLDTLAGQIYGDSSYWWVLAAASRIGWCLQVPAGTLIRIPTDLGQIGKIS